MKCIEISEVIELFKVGVIDHDEARSLLSPVLAKIKKPAVEAGTVPPPTSVIDVGSRHA